MIRRLNNKRTRLHDKGTIWCDDYMMRRLHDEGTKCAKTKWWGDQIIVG